MFWCTYRSNSSLYSLASGTRYLVWNGLRNQQHAKSCVPVWVPFCNHSLSRRTYSTLLLWRTSGMYTYSNPKNTPGIAKGASKGLSFLNVRTYRSVVSSTLMFVNSQITTVKCHFSKQLLVKLFHALFHVVTLLPPQYSSQRVLFTGENPLRSPSIA